MTCRSTPVGAVLLAALLVAPGLVGCAAAPKPTPEADASVSAPIVGGWSRTEITDEARAAAREAALAAIAQGAATGAALDRLESIETQVVAGLNYRLRFSLTDRSDWEAVVYRALDGSMRVTAINRRSIP